MKILRLVFIILQILFLISEGCVFSIATFQYLNEAIEYQEYITISICLLVGIICSIIFVRINTSYHLVKERRSENNVKFDVKTDFDNRYSLAYNIRYKIKNKNKKKACIAIQLFSLTDKYQYVQLKKINYFYSLVIEYLEIVKKGPVYNRRLECAFDINEFIVFFMYDNDSELDDLLAKLERDIYAIYQEAQINLHMRPIFGIYKFLLPEKSVQVPIERAEMALNHAATSYQTTVYYEKEFDKDMNIGDELQDEIQRGLQNHEFKVFYQPKYDLKTNKFCGAEALVRWDHPSKGLLKPRAFIDECEKSGLVESLDFYVFNEVCHDLGDWKRRGRRMIPISTNFSSYCFYRPDFLKTILESINSNDIKSEYVQIEITESSTATNQLFVMQVLKRLQNNGVHILMDDFGTGYSSLGNLNKYPINALKIDKSFIDGIATDDKSKEIVHTMVRLSKTLGLTSVAEGVQDEEQVKILRRIKCDQIQGFYYSEPLSKKAFEAFLQENKFEKKEEDK